MYYFRKKYQEKQRNLLALYTTAGYPRLEDTLPLLQNMEAAGVDIIELGMPYSDPLADGPTIQRSSQQALQNGMSIEKLFSQLKGLRPSVQVPVVLMGYLNPVLQYGLEAFLAKCAEVGIDALILPDLPPEVYEAEYQALFEAYDIGISFLCTPRSNAVRLAKLVELSSAFVYAVASQSITGGKQHLDRAYLQKIKGLAGDKAVLTGFGIRDAAGVAQAFAHSDGAIIGSAFIRALAAEGSLAHRVRTFVEYLEVLEQA